MSKYFERFCEWWTETGERFALGFIKCLGKHKNLLVQVALGLFVVCHACIGGAVLSVLEHDSQQKMYHDLLQDAERCLLEQISRNASFTNNTWRSQNAVQFCVQPHLGHLEWTYTNAILFSFTVMITHGYGNFGPYTKSGRAFYLLFALIGIPICMVFYANIGVHMKEGVCKMMTTFKQRKHKTIGGLFKSVLKREEPVQLAGWMVLVWFLGYVICGALIVTVTHPKLGLIEPMYHTFTALTGGDVKPLTDGRSQFLLVKVIYASIGFGIALIAMDMGSEYLKQLHNFGKGIKNAANAFTWFGGSKVYVKNLVRAVGFQFGIDPFLIQSLDYDHIAEIACLMQKGVFDESTQPKAFGPYVPECTSFLPFAEDEMDDNLELTIDRIIQARTVANKLIHDQELKMFRKKLSNITGFVGKKFSKPRKRNICASRLYTCCCCFCSFPKRDEPTPLNIEKDEQKAIAELTSATRLSTKGSKYSFKSDNKDHEIVSDESNELEPYNVDKDKQEITAELIGIEDVVDDVESNKTKVTFYQSKEPGHEMDYEETCEIVGFLDD